VAQTPQFLVAHAPQCSVARAPQFLVAAMHLSYLGFLRLTVPISHQFELFCAVLCGPAA